MCTANEAGFGSAAEALRAGTAFADYLNSPAVADLEPAALGEVLVSLAGIQSKLAVAQADFLGRFDAHDAHDADGYNSSAAWLAAKAKLGKKDAKSAVRRMRTLARHPLLARGMAAGEISESWAAEIVGWLKKLPEELREGTEKILADAAAAGASLDDLAVIIAAALAQWEADHPDEDDEGVFPDRFLQVDTTFGGAGVIRGDLTPECAAAVTAVLEALGKKAGPEDDRSTPQRFHDALQLACELLLRARLVPDRAGADTQVTANISLRDLRAMPGASGLEDVWIRALLGEGGYLTGDDAQAAACDAMIVPVVAGQLNGTVLDQMINLVLGAFGHHGPASADVACGRTRTGSAPRPDRAPQRGRRCRLHRIIPHDCVRLPRRRPNRPRRDITPGVAGAPLRPRQARRRPGLRAGRGRLDPAPRPARAPLEHPVAAAGHRLPREHPRLDPPRRQLARPLQMRLARLRPPRRLVRRPPHQAQETRRQNQRRLLRHAMPLPP